jgi:TolB-like protein/DNA-binding winged helix-turn-helix (wHTH) protein/Tfp pilus assembly protein PilF
MAVTSPPSRAKFGDFVADFHTFELRKHGIRLKLQNQPFQVLKLLLQQPGQLVTREQLRMELWTESTFVDFDAGLNAAIRRLRDALNDSADQPRYIETLTRHGYRFMAPVEVLGEAAAYVREEVPFGSGTGRNGQQRVAMSAALVSDPAIDQPTAHRAPWRLVAACALVAAVVIGAVALRSRVYAKRSGNGRVHSIAVLPLRNLSGDPSQDYFADAMTDALITNLAQSKSLRVISSTSSMRYKGAHKPLPDIARELNVSVIVEGSVIRSGNQLRITAQLLDATTDQHLWAQRYDRDLKDVLNLQNDLASAVAREVIGRLTPDDESRLAPKVRPVNPQAYEASLRGRYYWNKRSLDGFNKGLALFEQAAQADPTYAPAYAGMADCYNFLGLGMGSLPPREYAAKAKAAARRALELDENLASAHAGLGFTLYRYDWNWLEAEREYRRALELDRHNVIVRGWFAELLSFLGRAQEAEDQREEVRDSDPFSIQAVRSVAGAYGAAQQHDKAIDYYKKAIESEPDSFRMRMDLGGDYLQAQRYEDAVEEFKGVLMIYGPNVYPLARLGYTYALWGKTTEASSILDQLRAEHRPGYVSYAMAQICEALGRKEEALHWLAKAYDERAAQMIGLNRDFGPLRSDPRFQALAQRVGVPRSQL